MATTKQYQSNHKTKMARVGTKTYLRDISNRVDLEMMYDHCTTHGVNIHKFKKIPADEMRALVGRAKTDKKARDEVIRQNMLLCVKMTQSFSSQGSHLTDRNDIFQAALIGLNYAIDKYEPELGYAFSTYCVHWIEQSMRREVANNCREIRLPVHVWAEHSNLKKLITKLKEKHPNDPLPPREKLWKMAGISAEIGQSIDEHFFNFQSLSLEAEMYTDGSDEGSSNDKTLLNVLTHDEDEVVMNEIHDDKTRLVLAACLSMLNQRERFVLVKRMGLGEGDDWTLDEVGSSIGVTRERIRQIQSIAETKLANIISFIGIDNGIIGSEQDSPRRKVIAIEDKMKLSEKLKIARDKYCFTYKKSNPVVPQEILDGLSEGEKFYMYFNVEEFENAA